MSTKNDQNQAEKGQRRWLGVVAGALLGISGVAAIGAVQAPAPTKPAPAPAAAAAATSTATPAASVTVTLPAKASPVAVVHAAAGIRW